MGLRLWSKLSGRSGTKHVMRRGRDLAGTGADCARDALDPLLTIARGLRRLVAAARRSWERAPRERRGPVLSLALLGLVCLWLTPYGPPVTVAAVLLTAACMGRRGDSASVDPGPAPEEDTRLQVLYDALVSCFAVADDPSPEPLYAHGGSWERCFEQYEFAEDGRVTRLRLRYPAHFGDSRTEERLRVERLLCAKAGQGRAWRFTWDSESNRLEATALPLLPTDICAQHFVTAPGEAVLGFTDPGEVGRTLPVTDAAGSRDMPPVLWRTGPRASEPHLLVLGTPSSGVSTLLRSIALQALREADVLLVEGVAAGEFACLSGRRGVLTVESSLVGALSALEWAVHETERRLLTAHRARRTGAPLPEDVRRPLWLIVDRPAVLSHLARVEGRRDPQELLEVPLRHGRFAHLNVVVAEQLECAEALTATVRTSPRGRVVLGAVSTEQVRATVGAAPAVSPPSQPPPGSGYARVSGDCVLRLQVPATPDPYDEATSEAQRHAVMTLLPERTNLYTTSQAT